LVSVLAFGSIIWEAFKTIFGALRKGLRNLLEYTERKFLKAAANETITFSRRQLQHGFKHAKDFGVMGNQSNKTLAEFSDVIQSHITAPDTLVIHGTYHNLPATHFVNPNTGLNVIRDASGSFWSGWKLSPQQLHHVVTSGKL